MKISDSIPLPLVRSITKVNPLIVNYHMVSDQNLNYVNSLYRYRDVNRFISDVDFLRRNFHPIGMKEFIDSVKNKVSLPHNSVMLTFDDGFREMYDTVAPILSERKISATFFLTKNFINNKQLNYDNKKSLIIDALKKFPAKAEILKSILKTENAGLTGSILRIPVSKRHLVDEMLRELQIDIDVFLSEVKPYMDDKQITALKNSGFTLGGHSVDHSNFAEITDEEQIYQAVESVDHVVTKWNLDYRVFAFPYSDHAASTAFFRKTASGIDASFGTQGLYDDAIPTNFQRISVEKLSNTAENTVKFFYVRRKFYQILGKNMIFRN